MFAKERQNRIIEELNRQGHVKVKELSERYLVSEDCIRKDLSYLQKQGLLKKTYGGAIKVKENLHLFKSEDRKDRHLNERKIIALKAYDLIEENDVIYLDISLTSVQIAYLLVNGDKKVTVMTHMVEVLNVLCQSNCEVIFIGGLLNKERDGFVSALSIEMMNAFKVDKAFLGTVGVDVQTGQVYTYVIDDGLMKKKIMQQSKWNALLCESEKQNQVGNYVYAMQDDFDVCLMEVEEE